MDPEADADQLMSCVSALAHRDDTEEQVYREQLLTCLEAAVSSLSRRKRALIQRYYRDRKKTFSESHWRRRNSVRQKHDEIITILRSRIAA